MVQTSMPSFNEPHLQEWLDSHDDRDLDELSFGVIGFDAAGVVTRFNAIESTLAGLSRARVVGHALFTVVAPCMNNYLVAQQFSDATDAGTTLDTLVDYVLTLRMRPQKVALRLLCGSQDGSRYVLIERRVP